MMNYRSRAVIGIAALIVVTALSALPMQVAAEPDAATIMAKNREATLVAGSRMTATFELRPAVGSARIRKVSGATRLQQKTTDNSRVTRFESPPDARGIASLLVEHSDRDDEFYVYVPAVKKVRRMVADGKRDSFMGTVLSFGDVLGYKVFQWEHTLIGEESFEGRKCWVVVSVPKGVTVQDDTGYSKRQTWIDKENYVGLRMDAWGIDGKLLKTVVSRRVVAIEESPNRYVALETEAVDHQSGSSSRIVFDSYISEPKISAEGFQPSALGDDEP